MGASTTSYQTVNLLKQENLSGKSILELGFLQEKNVVDLKRICVEKDASFFRSNIEDGEGVDIVWNLHNPFPESYPVQKFDYIICSSVMEHVAKPWIAAKNIEDTIKSNGKLFWTTPWVWRIHGYPDDYWRYTPSAVKQIFSSMNWTFAGFEIPFDDNKRSLLFNWEDGMTNHAFELTRQGLGKLKRPVDLIVYETLSRVSEKDVIMTSETQSQVFSTKKFDIDTYATLVSGGSIVMLPMCTLFMVGEKCE